VIPAKRPRQNNSNPAAARNATNNNNIELSPDYSSVKKDYAAAAVIRPSRAVRAIIDRPMDLFSKPEVPELDVTTISETLKSKNITASTSKFGFIGLGIMGSGIVKNLINSGHDVCVYNRTHDKTVKFESVGEYFYILQFKFNLLNLIK
jgi:NAD binding domain of 6-phosphogluconate dehydrogenase